MSEHRDSSAHVPRAPATEGAKAWTGKRRLALSAIGLAVVVATFAFVLPRIADYRAVWAVVADLSWAQIAVLAAVTVANLVTFAPPWQVALPGLGFGHAFVVTQASTASTYLAPGGAAVGVASAYGVLHSWGFRARAVSVAVTVTGIWNQLALLAFPVVAFVLLTLVDEHDPLLQSVALIAFVAFVLVVAAVVASFWSPVAARWVGDRAAALASWGKRLIRRPPVDWTGEALVAFRRDTIGLLRRRWPLLTLTTLAGQLTVFLVLITALRTLGVSSAEVSAIEAFAAWSLVRLLGSLPITPGGLGVVEVGLTTALVGFGGANDQVVAAVLVYRFLTIVPTLAIGLVIALTWRYYRPKTSADR